MRDPGFACLGFGDNTSEKCVRLAPSLRTNTIRTTTICRSDSQSILAPTLSRLSVHSHFTLFSSSLYLVRYLLHSISSSFSQMGFDVRCNHLVWAKSTSCLADRGIQRASWHQKHMGYREAPRDGELKAASKTRGQLPSKIIYTTDWFLLGHRCTTTLERGERDSAHSSVLPSTSEPPCGLSSALFGTIDCGRYLQQTPCERWTTYGLVA